LLTAVRTHFVPNKIVAWRDPAAPNAAEIAKIVPLLDAKALVRGQPAAYVCENFACKQPVTLPEELLAQLGIK
jgi:uncharacterized protein YyaL (SSP411 family)